MSVSGLDLHFIVNEFDSVLDNAFFSKVQKLSDTVFRFKFNSKSGGKDVLFVLGEALFFSGYSYPSSGETSNFVTMCKKYLSGQRVKSVKQNKLDRTCYFEFDESFLVFEVFGKGNMILCDKAWKILAVLKPHTWKDRSVRVKRDYIFPESDTVSPFGLKLSDFSKVVSLETLVPSLMRFGLNPSQANTIKGKGVKSVFESFKRLLSEFEGKKAFSTAFDEEYNVDLKKLAAPTASLAETRVSLLKRRLRDQEKAKTELITKVEKYKLVGDWLYANFGDVEPILKAFKQGKSLDDITSLELSRFVKSFSKKNGKIGIEIEL